MQLEEGEEDLGEGEEAAEQETPANVSTMGNLGDGSPGGIQANGEISGENK